MGLTNDTTQCLECDFWSKHRTSFCEKIGSNKFNDGKFKYHIYGLNNTIHMVLFKVPHGCKREYESITRDLKQAKEEAPRHANWAETYGFMNNTREVSNLKTKKTLVMVKNISNIKKALATPLGMVGMEFK